MQYNVQISGKWSKSKAKISNMADVCFSKTEVVISQPKLRYVDKMWFADRLGPSEDSDINKYETGTAI